MKKLLYITAFLSIKLSCTYNNASLVSPSNPTETPSPSAMPSLAPVDPNAPVSIPDLMGTPSDQAISILQGLGLNPVLELQEGSNATLPLFVLEQSVAVGTLTLPGTNVTLKVVNATP
jgi:hypothetical protein